MPSRAAFRKRWIIITALGTIFCIKPEAFGCTCSPREYEAGTNFSVQVSDEHDRDLATVGVAVDRVIAVSDNKGIATFKRVPIGSHYVGVEEMAKGACADVVVSVTNNGPAPTIQLRWPGAHVIETQSATMTMIDSVTGAPLKASRAELLQALGGRRIAAVEIPRSSRPLCNPRSASQTASKEPLGIRGGYPGGNRYASCHD